MSEIRFSKSFSTDFAKLEQKARKGDQESAYLLKIIEHGISKLAINVESGNHIQKRLWPKDYVKKYGLNNLWKLNLDSFWRMLYTVAGQEAQIICIVLEVMGHKKYSRKLKYKK